MYTGTLSVVPEHIPERAQRLLESVYGVEVLGYDAANGEFRVRVSDESLAKLDGVWGVFVWVLTPEVSNG